MEHPALGNPDTLHGAGGEMVEAAGIEPASVSTRLQDLRA